VPHVEASATVDRSVDALWREVGSFHSVGEWHPMLARVEGRGDEVGALRTAETRDSQRQIERLTQVDPGDHRYRYEMVSTEMPVDTYVGDFSIRGTNGQSRILWAADFEVTAGNEKEVAGFVRQFLAAGVESLQRRYG
jgi:hypothetical protein